MTEDLFSALMQIFLVYSFDKLVLPVQDQQARHSIAVYMENLKTKLEKAMKALGEMHGRGSGTHSTQNMWSLAKAY